VRFVELRVTDAEQERRIADHDRRQFNKLADRETLRRLKAGVDASKALLGRRRDGTVGLGPTPEGRSSSGLAAVARRCRVALLIIPLGIALGWFLRPPRRAAVATQSVGFGAFVALSLLWGFTGAEVSPLEPIVLLLGTPVAGVLASSVSRWRLSRRPPSDHGAVPS
jgi:hypothetical protein